MRPTYFANSASASFRFARHQPRLGRLQQLRRIPLRRLLEIFRRGFEIAQIKAHFAQRIQRVGVFGRQLLVFLNRLPSPIQVPASMPAHTPVRSRCADHPDSAAWPPGNSAPPLESFAAQIAPRPSRRTQFAFAGVAAPASLAPASARSHHRRPPPPTYCKLRPINRIQLRPPLAGLNHLQRPIPIAGSGQQPGLVPIARRKPGIGVPGRFERPLGGRQRRTLPAPPRRTGTHSRCWSQNAAPRSSNGAPARSPRARNHPPAALRFRDAPPPWSFQGPPPSRESRCGRFSRRSTLPALATLASIARPKATPPDFAKIFFAPARSYSTTAADAREYQFNCGSELRFSSGITASRSTVPAGCRAQPPALIAIRARIVMRIVLRTGSLQNTRLQRHQLFELRQIPHGGKRRILPASSSFL